MTVYNLRPNLSLRHPRFDEIYNLFEHRLCNRLSITYLGGFTGEFGCNRLTQHVRVRDPLYIPMLFHKTISTRNTDVRSLEGHARIRAEEILF